MGHIYAVFLLAFCHVFAQDTVTTRAEILTSRMISTSSNSDLSKSQETSTVLINVTGPVIMTTRILPDSESSTKTTSKTIETMSSIKIFEASSMISQSVNPTNASDIKFCWIFQGSGDIPKNLPEGGNCGYWFCEYYREFHAVLFLISFSILLKTSVIAQG